jgi:hypothetical protein
MGVIKELVRRISLNSSGLCFELATKTSAKAECSLPMSIPVMSVGSFSWRMTKAVFSPCSRVFQDLFLLDLGWIRPEAG